MTLYEYVRNLPIGNEVTVWDKDYDTEVYFYNASTDNWDKQMAELSKLLTIEETNANGVVVNLSELIENRIDKLERAGLFHICNTDIIMAEIDKILSGFVSEKWMELFVKGKNFKVTATEQ